MRKLVRRRFLYCVGGMGAMAGLTSAMLVRSKRQPKSDLASNENQDTDDLKSVTRKSWALGANVSMTVLYRNESQANRAINAAFSELELVENLMSIYRPDSQLSRLNRDRAIDNPHSHLLEVLQAARGVSKKTNGAFDVTIQPLWDLYSSAQNANQLPSEAEVEVAKQFVDWRQVEIRPDQIRLRGEKTKITLNGIAQGFAADRVAETLQRNGVKHALIDTGEIGAIGAKPQKDGWTVGIQHPRDESLFLSLTKLAGRCLASSGDYQTTFSDDRVHHHLFDPRTGHSPTELSSVSIVAHTAMKADALSTAVFVMGSEAGMKLIRETPEADAMFVTKDGRTAMTADFPVV